MGKDKDRAREGGIMIMEVVRNPCKGMEGKGRKKAKAMEYNESCARGFT